MINTKTQQTGGLRVRPVSFDQARELIRDRFNGGDYWLAIFDRESMRLLIKIEDAHYTGAAAPDLDVATIFYGFQYFVVAAMKKNWLPAWKLRSLLKQTGNNVTEAELRERDCLLVVIPERMSDAVSLYAKLVGDDGLAVAA